MSFLGKDRIKKAVKLYDDNVKLPAALDLVDGFILEPLLNYADEKYLAPLAEKMKPEDQESVLILVDALLDQDVEAAEDAIEDFSNRKIDIPLLDEETEGKILRALIELIEAGVKKLLKKE